MTIVTPTSLLDVQGLRIVRTTAVENRPTVLVDDVSFALEAGETVCVIGKTGSGKTLTALALLGHTPSGLAVADGSRIWFAGHDLSLLSPAERAALRGREMGLVIQDAVAGLDPVIPVGEQIAEMIEVHRVAGRESAWTHAVDALEAVGIGDAARRARQRPHELSGGQRQRVLLAMALALGPSLLIADEPTASLDVTIQAEQLALLRERRERTGMAMLLITHDLGVVEEMAHRVLVMHGGRIVESGSVADLFHHPTHPYTRSLLAARPRWPTRTTRVRHETPPAASRDTPGTSTPPLLAVCDLTVDYPVRDAWWRRPRQLRAVDGVSLTVEAGETLALVGESGSGKSTLARAILHLVEPTAGSVHVRGTALAGLAREPLRQLRRHIQLVPQDAGSALDPRLPVGVTLRDGLLAHALASGAVADARVAAALEEVGLTASDATRLPHTFSGGERQRIGLARALLLEPALLICDEPVSALDVVVQAEILALLRRVQQTRRLGLLFITHDLTIAADLADRVAVMYAGRLVEVAPREAFATAPVMPYTRALLSAIPHPSPEAGPHRIILRGDPPSPIDRPAGCPFHPRCFHPERDATCMTRVPSLLEIAPQHAVACHKAHAP